MRALFVLGIALSLTLNQSASAAVGEWRAGIAKIRITPERPIWLTGFGARTNVSQGTVQELYAKALALEDASGARAVLVTSDLLGFPADVSESIAEEVKRQHGLARERLLFNSSHTHGAPALDSPVHFIYGPRANPEQWRVVEDYTRDLKSKMLALIGAAIGNLQPARLSFGQGQADFGVNRRKQTDKGIVSFVPNPDGPADHAVPVLRIDAEAGGLLGVVFGYAAHPTTAFEGDVMYQVSADYAGCAQEWLEKEHPGAAALFVQGCGGDIMVFPRGTIELARRHGRTLGAAVDKALTGSLRSVGGPLKTAFEKFAVAFATPPTREALESQLKHADLYHRWHAREMLRILERDGHLPSSYPYPLQVWRFGNDPTLIAMAGEVVVDFSLRLKKELGAEATWVAGYCNDVFAYIPSRRVLEEGGYEGGGAMIYYLQPGPFAPSIEETILRKAHGLVDRTRRK